MWFCEVLWFCEVGKVSSFYLFVSSHHVLFCGFVIFLWFCEVRQFIGEMGKVQLWAFLDITKGLLSVHIVLDVGIGIVFFAEISNLIQNIKYAYQRGWCKL